MMKITARIEGHAQCAQALQALDAKMRTKVTKQAAHAGGAPVLKEARRLAPTETKLLRRSLGQKDKVYGAVGVAVIGARTGFRERLLRSKGKWAPAPPPPSGYADPTKYSHLDEFGTVRSRPYAFIGPAVENKAAESIKAMTDVVAEALGGK